MKLRNLIADYSAQDLVWGKQKKGEVMSIEILAIESKPQAVAVRVRK